MDISGTDSPGLGGVDASHLIHHTVWACSPVGPLPAQGLSSLRSREDLVSGLTGWAMGMARALPSAQRE